MCLTVKIVTFSSMILGLLNSPLYSQSAATPVPAAVSTEEDANVFIGNYNFTTSSCPMFEDGEVDHAVIRIKDDYLKKNKELVINFYGEENYLETVKIGQGSGKLIGTDPKIHGEVTESWVARMETSLKMTVATTIQRIDPKNPLLNVNKKELQTIEIDPTGALIYTGEASVDHDFETCKMFPTLSKEQKKSACVDIISQLPSDAAVDTKACLKAGKFSVTENDEGQWWFNYSAKDLGGKQVTCEFGMEKPFGKFAPALEQCEVK